MLYTGIKVNETLALPQSDVDFENRNSSKRDIPLCDSKLMAEKY